MFIDYSRLKSDLLFDKIAVFSRGIFFLEGCIGVVQAVNGFIVGGSFDISNGDRVEGTVHLPLPSELSFANPIFCANMLGLLVLLIAYYFKKGNTKKFFLLIPGILSIILASVLHQIALFIVALLGALILLPNVRMGKIKTGVLKKRLLWSVVIMLIPITLFLGKNVSGISKIPRDIITNEGEDGIPKAIVTLNALFEVPKEESAAVWVGLGPGQFSSRAALIMSGLYFGGPENPRALPFIEPNMNPLADKYVFDVLVLFSDVDYFGSSQKPFYSFLSIYTEFGVIGFSLLLLVVSSQILKGRRVIKQAKSRTSILAVLGVFVLTLFIFFLGVQVNYYEVVQAIFLSILIITLFKGQYQR
ncbi:hypothetical protein [Ekhidna sp. MALMAid0563]|uniref:hypothetical protein n=1 Tax=Ekhidna sp. MALMAid0563 TaxID=3143937 RepID=UPI0032E01866